ncbi:uncharacterized protein LOC144885019 [Branchiostoma floridae x Branchiostoma japonicum]
MVGIWEKIAFAVILPVISFVGAQRVDVTLVNHFPFVADQDTFLKCVSDEASSTRDIRFNVIADVGNGANYPNQVSAGNIDPESWPGAQNAIAAGSGASRMNVFSCSLQTRDDRTAGVFTVKMADAAIIRPKLLTQTVSVQDEVVLEMTDSTGGSGPVIWRKDGSIISGESGLTLTIDRVGTQATGVFECYRTEEERSATEQAIMRLIVRSCPAGKWGGGCDRDCPDCKNGGVCNPSDGRCMCPPGFMGDTCDEACGTNGFGLNCEYKCSDDTDSRETCAGRLFCIQDPYACSCYIGFKPPECRDPCDGKTFGVNCLKDCNCKEQCDVVTGACDDGCEAGWEGSDCQTECEAGKFGEDCTETCHCLDDVACDRFTGHCPNDTCAGGWVGEICQDRPCSEEPCQNDGTCLDTPEEGPDYYTCTCTEGWEGTDCDEEIDECASDPCQNGGTCTDAFAEYACACTDKYEGDNCEVEIPGAGEDGGSAGGGNLGVLIGGAVGGVLVLAGLGSLAHYLVKKKKSKPAVVKPKTDPADYE